MTDNVVQSGYGSCSLRCVLLPLSLLWLCLAGCAEASAGAAPPSTEPRQPNVLLIMADDLGWSDLGAFGSEIRTPNLDRLAREGMRLTRMHAHIACSPSRAMLLTGVESHLAGFGTMAGTETPEQQGRPGYETRLNFRVVTIADMLRAAGYRTYVSGKWDMGVPDAYTPDKRGFDRSYVLLEGSADHFDQAEAMEGVGPSYRMDGRPVTLPADFYSSRDYTDRMIEFIDADRVAGRRPFFAYVAYTAPHYPLQAPDEYIARYRGRYDAGYEAVYSARIARQRSLGLIPDGLTPAPQHPLFPAWSSLSVEQRELEARRMEVYAAMVEAMDEHLGRLLRHLENLGELDDTLVIFLSDNGPEGSNPLEWGWQRWAEQTKDLSIGNMGRRRSYAWAGPGWAHVSAAPWRLFKAYTTQGGLLVPAIVRLPRRVPAGSVAPGYAHVLDVVPTLLEFTGARHPGPRFDGRELFQPRAGRSLWPMLTARAAQVHGPDEVTGWELWNRRALRKGDWKIVWINEPWGKGLRRWALYDLAADPTELHDLADARPDKLAELLQAWRDWVVANGVIEVDDFVIGGGVNSFGHYDWRPPPHPR